MQDEPAAQETSLLSRFPPEKIVATALVALLHIVLIWFLLRATIVEVMPRLPTRVEPITIWLQAKPKPKPPEPKPEEKKKKEGPAPVTRSIGPPAPAPSGAPPAKDYNGLRALGRYLNNCGGGNYEALSNREWAHCLADQWAGPGEAPLTLGTEQPSEWKAQLDKKKAPPRKVEHECAQGTINSNLGLPCYNFNQ